MKKLFDFNGTEIVPGNRIFKIGAPETLYEVTEICSLRHDGKISVCHDDWDPTDYLVSRRTEEDSTADREAQVRMANRKPKVVNPRSREGIKAKKEAFRKAMETAATIKEACATAGVTKQTVNYWRFHDAEIWELIESKRPNIELLKETYLQHYYKLGNVTQAREAAGVGRSQHTYWLGNDEEFRNRHVEITGIWKCKREQERLERMSSAEARKGVTEDGETVEETGELVAEASNDAGPSVEEGIVERLASQLTDAEMLDMLSDEALAVELRKRGWCVSTTAPTKGQADALSALADILRDVERMGWTVSCTLNHTKSMQP